MEQQVFDFMDSVRIDASPKIGEKLNQLLDTLLELQKYELDIHSALQYADYSHTVDDVAEGILQGRFYFYPLERSFVVGEIVNYPQARIYNVFLAGGELTELLDFAETTLSDHARALGCKSISVTGRHGWVKPLKAAGWTHSLSILDKEL